MKHVLQTAKLLPVFAFLLTASSGPSVAASSDATPAARAFERFKDLAGDWEGTNQKGQRVTVSYEVVASGSTVLERFVEPSDKTRSAMITMYHLDGGRLLLTHYCMVGNQPRMRAESVSPSGDEVRFELVDATNLTSPDAGHMHRAVFEFRGKDRLVSRWTWNDKGKDVFVDTQELSRTAASSTR